MQRLLPRAYVQGRAFELAKGDALPLEPFRLRLAEAGYASVSQVVSPGEFAVRGSLIDVYPMGTTAPLRIDLFDEEIEAIRTFDPESQRSLDSLDSVRLLPAREVPLDAEAIKEFRRRFRTRFEGDPTRTAIYRGVTDGIAPAGIEFYLPLFFEGTATLFDYLPPNAVIVHDAALPGALVKAWEGIEARYEDRRHDIERPILRPDELFLAPPELDTRLANFSSITLEVFKADTELQGSQQTTRNFPTSAARELRIDVRAEHPFAPFDAFLGEFGGRVLIAADSPGRREVLQEMFRAQGHAIVAVQGWDSFANGKAALALTVAPDLQGLTLSDPHIAIVSEAQLFGARARQERRRKRAAADPEAILRDLQDLNPGAPVVHEEYGVGRYVGMQVMEIAGQPGEFLVLEYMDGDRVYVPVHSLHLVSRYTGSAPESAPLHKLGTDQWARARKRAAEQIRDVAAELLDLYARRRAQQGLRLPFNDSDYLAFANAFPFEETEDQAQAIARCWPIWKTIGRWIVSFAAMSALARPKSRCAPPSLPSRAGSRWPCWLQRHCSRISTWRTSATVLPTGRCGSRRCPASAMRKRPRRHWKVSSAARSTLSSRPTGCCTRMRGSRTSGLIIVDEEHRFGVRDKERLQALRANVHVLTLTATPIPRTLNMALGGLRDLSLITTPPAERLAIKTFVVEWHGADAARSGPTRTAPRRPDVLRAQRSPHHRENRCARSRRWCPRPVSGSATARCGRAISSS